MRRERAARRSRLWFRRSLPERSAEEVDATRLSVPGWLTHQDKLATTSFRSMALRLPAHLRDAAAIAWQASRADAALAVGLTLASGLFTVVGILSTRGIAQALLAEGSTPSRIRDALPAAAIVGAALALRSALASAAGWAQARLTPQVTATAETHLVELTTRVDLDAFDDPGFADEMERARERGTLAASGLVEQAVALLTGLVGIAAATAALVVIHPVLVPLLALAVAPVGWATVRAARLEYVSLHRRIARRRRLWLLQSLMADRQTAVELRANQMRRFLLRQHRQVIDAETASDLQVIRDQTVTRITGSALSGVATVGVFGSMVGLLIAGRVPIDAAAAGVVALQTSRQALHFLVRAVNGVYEEALYFADFSSFCNRAAAWDRPRGTHVMQGAFREITFREVSLLYPGTTTPALDRATLTLRRGETVALVGENGSGKTTMARLLAALYVPTSGELCWDGTSVLDLSVEQLRRHISFVSQEYWHWPFTARENILIGDADRPEPSDSGMIAAAKSAGVHVTIEELPRGYDTLLDRTFAEGQELSGGQWQRIAVARALYRDAPLLICDEPSAALDPRAEHELFQRLLKRGFGCTTVLISHRLANVRNVDRIFVLHDGRVVEQGNHEELVAAGGRYADLFALQAEAYRS